MKAFDDTGWLYSNALTDVINVRPGKQLWKKMQLANERGSTVLFPVAFAWHGDLEQVGLGRRSVIHWRIAWRAVSCNREAKPMYICVLRQTTLQGKQQNWKCMSKCHCVNPCWSHSLNIMCVAGPTFWNVLHVYIRSPPILKKWRGQRRNSQRLSEVRSKLSVRCNSVNWVS